MFSYSFNPGGSPHELGNSKFKGSNKFRRLNRLPFFLTIRASFRNTLSSLRDYRELFLQRASRSRKIQSATYVCGQRINGREWNCSGSSRLESMFSSSRYSGLSIRNEGFNRNARCSLYCPVRNFEYFGRFILGYPERIPVFTNLASRLFAEFHIAICGSGGRRHCLYDNQLR